MIEVAYQAEMMAAMYGALKTDAEEKGRALADGAKFGNLPFDEAVEFFKSKEIMSADQFYSMDATARRRAFTISGDVSQYALERSRDLLDTAISTGLSREQFIDSFDKGSPLWGLTKRGKAHLNTVYNNAVQGAFNEGRFEQQMRLTQTRPYWKYTTAGDSAVRPAHAEMNGKVFLYSDPIWDEWYPPNGHNCRCSVVTINKAVADKEGVRVEKSRPKIDGQPVEPDPGWAGSPRANKTASQMGAKFEEQFDRAAVLKAPKQQSVSTSKPILTTGDMTRADETKRIKAVDKLANLTESEVNQLSALDAHFSIEPQGVTKAKRGELLIELPFYSQAKDQARAMIENLASKSSSMRMAQNATVRPRASYTRLDSRIFGDLEIARKDRAANQIARSSEVVVQIRAKNLAEEKIARDFALSLESGGPGAKKPWAIGPARIRGGALKEDKNFVVAYLNRKSAPGVGEQTVMTKKPRKGWKSEKVLVTKKQRGVLPNE